MIKLESWAMIRDDSDPFKAPEIRSMCLTGYVYGHPLFEDGTKVTTGAIENMDTATTTVTTRSGNLYMLGEAHPEYEKQFPNAKKRFFKDN